MPGTLAVLTHKSNLKLAKDPAQVDPSSPADRALQVLQDDRIFYGNQPIAIAVAETLEAAFEAADRVAVHYQAAKTVGHPPRQAWRMPTCQRKWAAPATPPKASAAIRTEALVRRRGPEYRESTRHPFRRIRRWSRTRPSRYGKVHKSSHYTTLRREFSATASASRRCWDCSRRMYG